MPNLLSKIFNNIKDAVEIPYPPGFNELSFIIHGPEKSNKLKRDLSNIIKNPPKDFSSKDADGWWSNIKNLTDSNDEEIAEVKEGVAQFVKQTKDNIRRNIKKLSSNPTISKDKNLKKMLDIYNKIEASDENIKKLIEKQKIISDRIEKNLEAVRKHDERKGRIESDSKNHNVTNEKQPVNSKENENSTASESVIEFGNLISENAAIDLLSRASGMFSSPELSMILAQNKISGKDAVRLARSIVYNLLTSVNDRHYKKLEAGGINKRSLMRAYKNRGKTNSRSILRKTRDILNGKKSGGEMDEFTKMDREEENKSSTDTETVDKMRHKILSMWAGNTASDNKGSESAVDSSTTSNSTDDRSDKDGNDTDVTNKNKKRELSPEEKEKITENVKRRIKLFKEFDSSVDIDTEISTIKARISYALSEISKELDGVKVDKNAYEFVHNIISDSRTYKILNGVLSKLVPELKINKDKTVKYKDFLPGIFKNGMNPRSIDSFNNIISDNMADSDNIEISDTIKSMRERHGDKLDDVYKTASARKANPVNDNEEPEEDEELIGVDQDEAKPAKPNGKTGLIKEKPPKKTTPGSVIYRKMMDAAKNSDNPTAAADAVLRKYEDMGIPEASIVRRMYERSFS